MKTQTTLKSATLAVVAALAVFAGCKKQESHSENDGHDHTGQEQAKAEATPKGPAAAIAQTPLSGAKCAKHNAPKELCFMCDASLREKGRLWCKEHDRYEDRCWICHPEAQDKNRLWCKEHSLYEDECFLCHPEVKKKGA
ncbi:hypothetical protein NXS98_04145 [Fontisphaera persica]|uniref:hypothetical protein n=1 Tax=Fontisphaera persica TaxID=2974023 RepID=UPI0024BF5278|nr:hypothetical protein [Fontisphaera persica]WCJ60330.1 hypothetical protein NXS98_04145 [Fontisphaera persica]